MNDAQGQKSRGKAIALVVLVAIVTAIAVTIAQRLLLGDSNPAVTGGVVGAVSAVMAINTMRKRSG